DNMYLRRFGKKALSSDLLQQTIFAANQDMGIVSTYAPVEPYDGQIGDPEISNQTIKDIEFYLKTLKAPERRNEDHPDVLKGEAIFRSEEHTSELQSRFDLVCRLLLEKKK